MKTKKMRYVWFLAILCIFCLTLFLARTRSKVDMRNRIYRQWQDHFVVSKGKEVLCSNKQFQGSDSGFIRSAELWNGDHGSSC